MKKIILFLIIIYSCNNKNDFQKANEEFNNKNYTKSIKYYLSSIDNIPEKSRDLIYRKLAISYFNIKDYNNAINYSKKSLKINPEEDNLKYILIDSYLNSKKGYKAISEVKKLIDSNKKLNKLIDAYIFTNNYHEAKETFNKLIYRIKNKNELLNQRYIFARKILQLKKYCKEKYNFFFNIEKNYKVDDIEDFYKYYYNALKCDRNDFSNNLINKKIEILEKLIKKNDVYYYNELFDLKFLKKDIKRSKEIFKISKKLNPRQNRLIYMEALLKYSNREYKKSLKLFTSYTKLNDKIYDNNYSKLFISRIYTINKEYNKAIKLNKDILKQDKKNEYAYLELFTLYKLTNKKKDLEKIKKTYYENLEK